MRRSLVGSVMILGILAWMVSPSFCQAKPVQEDRAGQSAVPVEGPVWQVKGHGETEKDAEDDALKEARKKVVEYLTEKYGELAWIPSPAELPTAGITTRYGEVEGDKLPISGPVKKVM